MPGLEVSKAIRNINKFDLNKVRADYMMAKRGQGIVSNEDLINLELLALKYGYKELVTAIGTVLRKTFYDNADEGTLSAVEELNTDIKILADKFEKVVKTPAGDNTYI